MALSIPITWSDLHRLHAPETGVWVGVPIEADELLGSAELIRAALVDAGATAIFGGRDDVLTASVHVDPAEGWFPHFLGFADEGGPGNLNVPLASGSADDGWLAGVDRLIAAAREHESEAAVVALGVDAGVDDPNSRLAVTEDGFREAGRRLGALGLPTVVVQEGGYVLDTVGPLVRAVLEGLDEAG